MNNFLTTIENKGWDKFLLDVQNEFKHIRENLSLVELDDFMSIPISSNKPLSSVNIITKIQTEDEIKKEFIKLRETLNIESFNIQKQV